MDDSLIPADEDQGVWDELHHEQSREIQQHLSQHHNNDLIRQTLDSIRSVAQRAAVSFQYHQVQQQQPTNLADFGLDDDHGDPLLPDIGYEEFPPPPSTQQQDQPHDSFIFLQQFRLPRPQSDAWGAVSNLDLFFSSLYSYYYHRGLTPIICKGVVDLITLFITLWLSVTLFAYIDWRELAKCTDEQTCKSDFRDYMVEKPFSRLSVWNCVVILYCILFTFYGIFSLWSFGRTIQEALHMKQFLEDRLGIAVGRLEGGGVDWDRDVVTKLVELQSKGDYRIVIQGNLDALVIAHRIMRKENFLVAFFNRGLLDLSVPCMSQQTFFCKSLEWSIYFCVLNYMFNHKYQIRPAFYLDPAALRRRFIICGIAHAIFLPFLAFFMTLHFLMQNVYEWKSTRQYLGPKEWSQSAKWTFREFNELPHLFERRLGPSYEATEDYLKLFTQSEFMTMVGRILAFIGGSFGSVLLVFAAVNDAILLHVKLGHFNLLWFVGIMAALYSAGKSMLPSPKSTRFVRNMFAETDQALNDIATHTHHYPDVWKGRGYDVKTKNVITSMFNNKAVIFLKELASLLVAPAILCYSLPRSAEHICEFVMSIKAEVPGAGDVCGFATFNFDEFGDDNWEGKTMRAVRGNVSASVAELGDVEAALRLHPRPKAYHGKMEKSFFSFRSSHPNWTSTKSGQTLIDRVEEFRQEETRALAMEQQQHMAAAARQLETLARLEQRTLTDSPVLTNIQESYIGGQPPQQPGADSGGGGMVSRNPPDSLSNMALTPAAALRLGQIRSPLREITPPPFAIQEQIPPNPIRAGGFRSQPLSASMSSALPTGDANLSVEARQDLSRSMVIDPNLVASLSALSTMGRSFSTAQRVERRLPMLPENDPEEQQRLLEQTQFMWLQRYHEHTAEDRRVRDGHIVADATGPVGTSSTPLQGNVEIA